VYDIQKQSVSHYFNFAHHMTNPKESDRNWYKLFNRHRSFYAWLATATAFVFSLIHMPHDVVPGDSAMLIAQHAGIDLFAPLSHVVWGWFGQLFGFLPIGSIGLRWNLLSVMSGSAACGILCLLVTRLIGNQLDITILDAQHQAIRNLAGMTAGLLLAFCLPFHIVSTIAHPITLELLMVLVAFWLYARFTETRQFGYAVASVALFGITITQYSTAIMLAPFWGVMMLYSLWWARKFRAAPMALLALVFLLGLSVVLIIATLFKSMPGYHWAEMQGIGQILRHLVQDIYVEVRHGTPTLAITTVAIFSVAPFVFIVLMPKQMTGSTYLLMLISAGLSLLLFFHIRFAPWPMFGFRPLLIMPYVIAATWTGCLIGYVMSLIQSNWIFRFRYHRKPWLQRLLSHGWLLIVAVFVFCTAATSFRHNSIQAAMSITRYAESIADQIIDGAWLIVDGQLEPLVRMKAYEKGKAPVFLSAQRFGHHPYQNALVHQLGNDRLASMVRMGLVPLLRERLHPDHLPAPPVAVVGDPGLLRFVAGTAWPDRALYWFPEPEGILPESYMDTQREFWRKLSGHETNGIFHELERRLLMQSARVANDAGVWLQDRERPELAAEAYREAMRIDPSNLSAHLNARALLPDDHTEATTYDEGIERLSANLRGKRTLVQITDMYGQIRHEAAFRESKLRWNLGDSDAQVDNRIEEVLRIENDAEALIAIDNLSGGDHAMKLGIVRFAASRNRPTLARTIIDSMTRPGPHARAVLIEGANIDIQLGNKEKAYRALKSIPEPEIDDPRVLIMLALLTVETQPQECDRYLEKLSEFPNLLVSLWLPIARIHEARGRLEQTAKILSQLTAIQPLNQDALRSLIRIQLERGDLMEAINPSRQLLAINTRDPWANAALALYLASVDRQAEADEAKTVALAEIPGLEKYFNKVKIVH